MKTFQGGVTQLAAWMDTILNLNSPKVPCRISQWPERFDYQVTTEGQTWLHLASQEGDFEACFSFLTVMNSETIEAVTSEGYTALHLAAKNGHLAIAELLLTKMGMKAIEAVTSEGYTALHLAAMDDHLAVAELLSTRMSSAAIQATDLYGCTAMHVAIICSQQAIYELLVTHMRPEAIEMATEIGTALHWAAETGQLAVCESLLIRMSAAALQMTDCWGQTALHLAANHGQLAVCQLLLHHIPVHQIVKLMNDHLEIKGMVSSVCQQFIQANCFKDQADSDNSHQVKLLKLYQALDHRIEQVDHYIAKHFFEFFGVCKVINQEAPIAALFPIYDDYMVQVLVYLPRHLLWPMSNVNQNDSGRGGQSNSGYPYKFDSASLSHEDETSSEITGAESLESKPFCLIG